MSRTTRYGKWTFDFQSKSNHVRWIFCANQTRRIFNTGSPWNVPAGHGSANLDTLIAKYEKEAYEENDRKLKQLRDNNVPVEKEFESFRKVTPAAKDS